MTLARVEAILAQDGGNGLALGHGVVALAVLGHADRCRDWVRRALLMDPDNQHMRYNLACALSAHLKDIDGALAVLEAYPAQVTRSELDWAKTDPDLELLRESPIFQAMVEKAETRLAAEEAAVIAAG